MLLRSWTIHGSIALLVEPPPFYCSSGSPSTDVVTLTVGSD
ncbi:hypothetical protein [Streptomyces sp. CA-288835]